MRFRIIGPGRAGGAFAAALTSVGWTLDQTYDRHRDPVDAASVDPGGNPGEAAADMAVLLCVPDDAVRSVAAAIAPGDAVILHVSGSLGLDQLAGHGRVGSIHPLMTLPDAERGAARLLDRCHFAVAGDPMATAVAAALGGRPFTVADDQRALYHATAAVASNHLVALAGQVERLANAAGVPPEAFWPLMTASLANATEAGPATALTGPAARGDWGTIRRHLAALDLVGSDEVIAYKTVARLAADLAGQQPPEDLL